MTDLTNLATFPCHADKSPLGGYSFKLARPAPWASPLVGMPTGAVNGIDVLDIDGDAGREWFDQNFDALPATRAHSTRRGVHLLFRAAEGLRCSVGRVAPGVDVRAEGGYVIWWPREGFPVEEGPLCEWPGWLLKEAMESPVRLTRDRRLPPDPRSSLPHHDVSGALMQLDPVEFVGDRPRWLALMNGAKAAGVPLEVFCEWTSGQDHYARNDGEVARDWWSLRAEHPGAFYAELSAAGITCRDEGTTPRVRSHIQPTRTVNFYARTEAARRPLQRARGGQREPELFNAACIMAEMIAEKRMAMKVAVGLLKSDCQMNGLWKENKQLCERAVGRAFRLVEEKVLEREG